MRKDLVLAHQLAEEQHDLEYYKGVLQQFQDELLEKQKAAEEKAAAAAAPKSSKKSKAVVDEDVEMEDVDDEPVTKKDKKRKNTESSDAQRADSAKKPKIKLTHNSTPKANGASSKSGKAAGESKSKKAKKPKEESEERTQTPKEPEVSAEDRFERKQKEVLFLRHKLQKGLLLREQRPKEEEMGMMSDYLTKLEGFPDLETSIIRFTKINKVLKAMLKLDNIPREEEFEFKHRSQTLLDKWNKLLVAEEATAAASAQEMNGINGHKTETAAVKEEPSSATNGADKAAAGEAEAAKDEVKPEETKNEVKEEEKKTTEVHAPASEADHAPKKEEVSATEEKPKVEQVGAFPQYMQHSCFLRTTLQFKG